MIQLQRARLQAQSEQQYNTLPDLDLVPVICYMLLSCFMLQPACDDISDCCEQLNTMS